MASGEGLQGSSSHATSRRHIRSLTGLRFIAAIQVVLYHNSQMLQNGWPAIPGLLEHFVHVGYSGVNLFFVLSGFILTYTYASPDGGLAVTLRRFWLARFARIYPLYFFSLLLVAPLVVGHFLSTNAPLLGALKITVSAGAAVGLVQAWIPGLGTIWNPPAWSLSVEAFFYLLFPVLVSPIWRAPRSRAVLLGLACWAFSLVPWLMAIRLVPDAAGVMATDAISTDPVLVFLRDGPILRLQEFVLGICLARLVIDRDGSIRRLEGWPLRWGGAILAFGVVGIVAIADRIPRMLVHGGALDFFYVFLIVYLVQERGAFARLLASRPFVRLGEASYGIYILHIPILSLMLLPFDSAAESRLGLGFLIPYVGVVIGGSLLAFHLIEEPARRFVNERAARLRDRRLRYAAE